MNPYETDKLLGEYLLFHYGTADEVLPWGGGPVSALDYPVRCVSECVDVTALQSCARALDVGCAVGRSTFELARHCAEAIGIDYSRRFVEAAEVLARDGVIAYQRADEGALATRLVASVPADIHRERVKFECGDAQALRDSLGSFDVVLAANLIDRLREPSKFLTRAPALVRSGGQLVITSPYTWLEEYTPANHWLGGFVENVVARTTLDGLTRSLSEHFTLAGTKDLPFLIREHARKYQWSVAQASIWRRK
jgi:putative 4-mercaptohistidine N1-methyltranferase